MNIFEACKVCALCAGSVSEPVLFHGDGDMEVLAVGSAGDLRAQLRGDFDPAMLVDCGVATTYVVRCLGQDGEVDDARLEACSVYTRFLAGRFPLLLLTLDAAAQLGVLDNFEVGRAAHTPYGWVLFVHDLRDWLSVPDLTGVPTSPGKTGKGWF